MKTRLMTPVIHTTQQQQQQQQQQFIGIPI